MPGALKQKDQGGHNEGLFQGRNLLVQRRMNCFILVLGVRAENFQTCSESLEEVRQEWRHQGRPFQGGKRGEKNLRMFSPLGFKPRMASR